MKDDERPDPSKGQVNKITNALSGVATTLDRVSQLQVETAEKIAVASDRHAKSLVIATWALVGATIVLVIVTGIHAYIAFTVGE